MTTTLRLLFGALLVLNLSGCALSTYGILPLEQRIAPMTVKPDEGVFVLRTISAQTNSPLNSSFTKWDELTIVALADGKNYHAISRTSWISGQSLFITTLPAGAYRPVVLESRYSAGNYQYTETARIAEVGSFEVRAGEVVDIGTIALLPAAQASESPKPTPAAPASRTQQALAVVQIDNTAEAIQINSFMQSKLPAMRFRHGRDVWQFRNPERKVDVPENRQGISTQFAAPLVMGRTGFSGEELGQIRIRESGQWTWIDTGLSSTIRALDVLEDGTILAGGEMGLVVSRKPGGREWITHPLPLQASVVKSITHDKELGILAATFNGDFLVLFRKKTLDSPWVESMRMPYQKSGAFNFSAIGHQGVLTQVSFTDILRLSSNDGAWSIQPLPQEWAKSSGSVSLTKDGSLFVIVGKGDNQSVQMTTDGGKTWQKRTSPGNLHTLTMLTDKLGFAVQNTPETEKGGWTTPRTLCKTLDGGLTWIALSAPTERFLNIVAINNTELVAKVDRKPVFYVSNDEGKTWREELGERFASRD